MNQDRNFLYWQEGLREAEKQWCNHQQDKGSLLRGAALQTALDWLALKQQSIPEALKAFIECSQQFTEKEANKRKRLRQVLTSFSVLIIVVLTVLGVSLYHSLGEANQARRSAEKQTKKRWVTQSRFLADLSQQYLAQGNSRRSVLLALAALPDYSKPGRDRRPFVAEASAALYANLGKVRDHHWLSHSGDGHVFVDYAALAPMGAVLSPLLTTVQFVSGEFSLLIKR